MNTLSDEEFEQIYGRKPVRRVKKKKIYWNRIIIALIILIGIVTGLVKLTALVVSKIKGDDTQKTNKVLNNTSSVAVKEDASSAEDKKDEPAKYSNMDFTVCVDAGHGDYDGGTTDASGKRYEKAFIEIIVPDSHGEYVLCVRFVFGQAAVGNERRPYYRGIAIAFPL